jgi:capsular exopolysaccharide synthesis family protein
MGASPDTASILAGVEGAFPPEIPPPPPAIDAGGQQGSIGPYLHAIRSHPLVVLFVVLAALAGSVAWLSHRSAHYKATADILFTPVPSDNEGANGLPVLRDSSDPTRLSQTAASLLDTPQAAILAAKEMGGGWTPSRIREAIDVEPQGQSDIISVVAKSSSPGVAERLANAFVAASLAARRSLLQSEAASLAPLLKTQAPANDVVGQERRSLVLSLSQGQDPNFSVSELAARPSSPTDTAAWLVIALALLAGFAVGSGAAVVTDMVSDRVKSSDELLSLYRLPALAYVPVAPRRGGLLSSSNGAQPVSSPASREAFRMVRVQLDTGADHEMRGCRTILITSGSSGDGKTTSSIAVATALAEGDHRVILIDLDLRKPDLGRSMHMQSQAGVTSLLDKRSEVAHTLVKGPVPKLGVIPAGPDAGEHLLPALTARLPSLMDELRELADYIVIDTPPLGEVSDAYQLLPFADQIIVVARPGNTRRAGFQFMRDLLSRAGRTPLGVVVIGETANRTSTYYYGQSQMGSRQASTWLRRLRA